MKEMPVRRVLAVGLVALGLAGCGTVPERVSVEPQPEHSRAEIGREQPVAVTVVDRRGETPLGSYESVYGKRVRIDLENDLTSSIRDQVGEGIAALGFIPMHDAGEELPRGLTVEILHLEYQAARGYVSGEMTVWAELRGIARNGGETYRVRYRMRQHKEGLFNPGSPESLRLINTTLTTVLEELLKDPKLITVLVAD